MEFGPSEAQVLLVDSLDRLLRERVPLERVRRFAEDADDADIWQALTELGIAGLLVDPAAGGTGLECLDAALAAEVLGHHATPAPFLGTAVAAPLALAGSDPLLADVAAGRLRVGLALTESSGARAGAGVTSRPGDGGRLLSGTALFAMGYPADRYLLADRERRLLLIAGDAPGLAVRPLTTIDRTRPTAELALESAPAVLIDDDPALLERILDAARIMLAADTIGAAQRMLDEAVRYAGERQQFGRPIGSFQAVKHLCAEMAAALTPCRAMLWYAAHAFDHLPQERHLTACHLKAHSAEVGTQVARTATEVHGGMGFTDLLGLHYYFKRIGYNRQMLGNPELLREEAARAQQLV